MVGAGRSGRPCGLTGVRETDAVACSLHRASESLRQSMAERSQAAADLLASEDRKQLLQQTVLAQESRAQADRARTA